jgi:hypothetical protein
MAAVAFAPQAHGLPWLSWHSWSRSGASMPCRRTSIVPLPAPISTLSPSFAVPFPVIMAASTGSVLLVDTESPAAAMAKTMDTRVRIAFATEALGSTPPNDRRAGHHHHTF